MHNTATLILTTNLSSLSRKIGAKNKNEKSKYSIEKRRSEKCQRLNHRESSDRDFVDKAVRTQLFQQMPQFRWLRPSCH